MPNYVRNVVKMSGITALPLFVEKMRGGSVVTEFDFNRIIPMPASLKMTPGSMEELAIEAALRNDAVLRYEFVQKYPHRDMGEREYQERVAMYDKTVRKLCEIGLQYINNLKLYGATTWCGWCDEHWGTKRNAQNCEQIDRDTIKFDTEWAAPEKVIAQLSRMYPSAEIEHRWAEENMGYNTGCAKYSGGEAREVHCFDSCSSQAYETYILCWGRSQCLYQDKSGAWKRKNCAKCHGCD